MNNIQLDALNQFKDKKLLVWGDLILDEFIYTISRRISREAPVLITEYISNELIPGGAGNVVMNLRSLMATPVPVGFIGKDQDGERILSIFKEKQIPTDGLIQIDNFRTPKKSRILSGGENTKKQQVLRIDTRNEIRPGVSENAQLLERISDLTDPEGLIIVSDYLEETVNPEIFKQLKKRFPKMQSVIDSRKNLLKFEQASILTPNEPEMKNLFPNNSFLSESDYLEAGTTLLKNQDVTGVLFKRGHKGMIVFSKNNSPEKIDIYGSSSIVDVTGAGDTVISVLSLSLLSGLSVYQSAMLANIAGGIVVMYEGTYPIQYEELYDAVKKIS